MTITPLDPPRVAHPLDPLDPAEIARVVALIRADARCDPGVRFASISLAEPPKPQVLAYRPGDAVDRERVAVLIDPAARCSWEVRVSLTGGGVRSWERVPAGQAPVTAVEFFLCQDLVRSDPD